MATLPDIDTSTTSWIAYYNVLEQAGFSDFNPDDVLSWGNITSSTYYDNGVAGTANIGRLPNYNVSFRAKTDGWIVMHAETSDAPSITSSKSQPTGDWSIMDVYGNHDRDFDTGDWSYPGDAADPSATNNNMERGIKAMYDETPQSGDLDTSYSAADVGLYNYHHGASAVTAVSDWSNGSGDGDNSDYHHSVSGGSLSYTSATTIHRHYMVGRATSATNYKSQMLAHSRTRVGGSEFADTDAHYTSYDSDNEYNRFDGGVYGVARATDEGFAQNSGTSYTTFTGDVGRCNSANGMCAGSHVLLWS